MPGTSEDDAFAVATGPGDRIYYTVKTDNQIFVVDDVTGAGKRRLFFDTSQPSDLEEPVMQVLVVNDQGIWFGMHDGLAVAQVAGLKDGPIGDFVPYSIAVDGSVAFTVNPTLTALEVQSLHTAAQRLDLGLSGPLSVAVDATDAFIADSASARILRLPRPDRP